MIEIEGIISLQHVFILIDLGASLSYTSPTLIETCNLEEVKHKKSWLFQLATDIKMKVVELVRYCSLIMNGMNTKVYLKFCLCGL